MELALSPPIKPQLARSRKTLPTGEGLVYEPKWDGFRAIAFVDGEESYLQSRGGKPLSRYFPEVALPSGRYVIDGELVILDHDGCERFAALQNRIHPAESRINRLAEETPAILRVFDLLAVGRQSALDAPFAERRRLLERLIDGFGADPGSVELTPLTDDPDQAAPWLQSGEGVIAKELNAPYLPGERKGMTKIKRVRTMDAVLVGWRPGKEERTVGSLILGLYDGPELRVVGHTTGLKAAEKRELVETLAPYESGERGSGDASRWDAGRELEWISLRPELVVEVSYDHVSSGRIRHGAKLERWRTDRDPASCTFDQLG